MSPDQTLLLPPYQTNEVDSCHIGSHYSDGPEHDVTLLISQIDSCDMVSNSMTLDNSNSRTR